MKIELTKQIQFKTIEMIAEVDFYKKSPYLNLLKDHRNKDNLEQSLRRKGIEPAAVKNIICHLKSLGVMDPSGSIQKVGELPEYEYGKYEVSYYENDDELPFKYHVSGIKRVAPVSENSANEIQAIEKELRAKLLMKNCDFKGESLFEIKVIKANQARRIHEVNKPLKLKFEKDQWQYQLDKHSFEMDSISISQILDSWNEGGHVQEVSFKKIENNPHAIHHFELKEKQINVNLDHYGNFRGIIKNIPIIPEQDSCYRWFNHLFWQMVEDHASYMTLDEVEQIALNLYTSTPQFFDYYEIPLDYGSLVKEGSSAAARWYVMAAKDLNPFGLVDKKQECQITFEDEEEADLKRLFDQLGLGKASELIILDRYINTEHHFKSLAAILNCYPNIQIKIATTENYQAKKSSINAITKIIEQYGIQRIIKPKNEIPHDRHWVIDKKDYWLCSKSIDFIEVLNENINVKHTHFSLVKENKIEPVATYLMREMIREVK